MTTHDHLDPPPLLADVDRLDALAAGLGVLARFHLDPPDDATLTELWGLVDEWPLPGTADARTGLRLLREARGIGEDGAAIHDDHSRLYGTAAVARVAPYESVHRGEDGLIFDSHTLEVRQIYRLLDLHAPRVNREPDDHIGLELSFLGRCCERTLDALERGADDEAGRIWSLGAEFYREHLARWAPAMLARVAEEARTRFMRGLAHLSLGALVSAAELVERQGPDGGDRSPGTVGAPGADRAHTPG